MREVKNFTPFIVLPLALGILLAGSKMAAQDETSDIPKPDVFDKPFDDPFAQPGNSGSHLGSDIDAYVYSPVDQVFWDRITEMLQDSRVRDRSLLAEIYQAMSGSADDSHRLGEVQLALGGLLERMEIIYGAFFVYRKVALEHLGGAVGEKALNRMGRLMEKYPLDDREVTRIINSRDFLGLHPEIQSFVSYFRAMQDRLLGLREWSQDQLKQVQPKSHWQHRLIYARALALVNHGEVEQARLALEELLEDKPSHWLESLARLQLARLHFELGQWSQAEELYYSLRGLPLREQGRVLLERAWTRYYQKDFANSLGVLKALENPFLEPSLTFEKYLLEMIIYRDLCHYQSVKMTAGLFEIRFGPALKHIRSRRPLRLEKSLFSMALLDRKLQPRANLLDQLTIELRKLQSISGLKSEHRQELVSAYEIRIAHLQEELNFEIEDKAREVAFRLLEANEQVTFIEYTSSLESLRSTQRSGRNPRYRLAEVPTASFEQIYWPVFDEYWWDELNDYRAIISNRCEEN